MEKIVEWTAAAATHTSKEFPNFPQLWIYLKIPIAIRDLEFGKNKISFSISST